MWETAMTSLGHVNTASLKIANNTVYVYIEGHLLSVCISKSSAHPSLKPHSVNLGTLNSRMWKLCDDETNRHGVINESFCVEECCSYINIDWQPRFDYMLCGIYHTHHRLNAVFFTMGKNCSLKWEASKKSITNQNQIN